MANQSDRIEKSILLKSPFERAWRALSEASEFGRWFGMKLDGAFEPGRTVTGTIVPTTVDDTVAALQKEFEGLPVELVVERVDGGEDKSVLSFRWRPHAIERGADYSNEPRTLVTFELTRASGGALLTVTEAGFLGIPEARRAKAYAANEGGWGMVVTLVEKYLAKNS